MGMWELFIIGIGLSMDAFAVAVCKGLSVNRIQTKHWLTVGIYFGGFQFLMPLIGYFLGSSFRTLIANIDHWIAFILLVLIGLNMIRESRGAAENLDSSFSVKTMIPLAVATSIDALAVGITFAFLQYPIVEAISVIGVTTFAISIGGVYVGNFFGNKYKSKAEFVGGLILVLIGLRILLTHLGIL